METCVQQCRTEEMLLKSLLAAQHHPLPLRQPPVTTRMGKEEWDEALRKVERLLAAA